MCCTSSPSASIGHRHEQPTYLDLIDFSNGGRINRRFGGMGRYRIRLPSQAMAYYGGYMAPSIASNGSATVVVTSTDNGRDFDLLKLDRPAVATEDVRARRPLSLQRDRLW